MRKRVKQKPIAADLGKNMRGANLKTHGMTGTPEHRSWRNMMTRCYSTKPGDHSFHLYRGRGIVVCNRWHSFQAFFADMGQKPSPKHSIDRFPNPAGNYEPDNCRWATAKEQARNWASRNALYEYAGETLTETEWAERIGITRESLRDRIKSGWTVERALTTPPVRMRKRLSNGTFA